VTDLTVAETIAEQIGAAAFLMMGTTQKLGDEKSLMFTIRGCKTCNKIRVTLDGGIDLYTLEFIKVGRAPRFPVTTPVTVTGVFAEDLKSLIEQHTGLRLSLPRVRGLNA
jgi:hypothetical protein